MNHKVGAIHHVLLKYQYGIWTINMSSVIWSSRMLLFLAGIMLHPDQPCGQGSIGLKDQINYEVGSIFHNLLSFRYDKWTISLLRVM